MVPNSGWMNSLIFQNFESFTFQMKPYFLIKVFWWIFYIKKIIIKKNNKKAKMSFSQLYCASKSTEKYPLKWQQLVRICIKYNWHYLMAYSTKRWRHHWMKDSSIQKMSKMGGKPIAVCGLTVGFALSEVIW